VSTHDPSRLLGVSTAVAGLFMLYRPDQASRLAEGNTGTGPPGWVVRLLGARYLLQGAAELGRPTKTVWLLACGTDTAHAMSMFGMAAIRPAFRRTCLTSAAVASVSAAATAAVGLRR
jgi:hypothetical protein